MRALPLMVVIALFAAQHGLCAEPGRTSTPRTAESTAPVEDEAVSPADPRMEVAAGVLESPASTQRQGLLQTGRLVSDDADYAAMTEYVLAKVGDGKPVAGRNSALLDQRSLANMPQVARCADQRPALIMDLDRGAEPFDLGDAPTPAPGLEERLRLIRGRGIAVVWLASLPQDAERDILTIVKAAGLDPLGLDRTLLLRAGEKRKQQILNRANEEWCVLAVAGDRRSDFDEVFDYLRNPDGPVALALEQHIGAGWFLVPPPIH